MIVLYDVRFDEKRDKLAAIIKREVPQLLEGQTQKLARVILLERMKDEANLKKN